MGRKRGKESERKRKNYENRQGSEKRGRKIQEKEVIEASKDMKKSGSGGSKKCTFYNKVTAFPFEYEERSKGFILCMDDI